MTLLKQLTIVVVAIGALATLGFYFYDANSDEPVRPSTPRQVTLSWDKTKHVKSFNIYRRPYRIVEFTKLGSSETTTYVDAAAMSGERYCYAVSAVDSKDRESVKSTELCVTIPRP
jgi:fibronectin type 3 domain-containing protein